MWTAYEMHTGEQAFAARPKRFRRDAGVNSPAADADYRNSGYSRGHMVPAADMSFSEEAMRDSFLLSNAVPQNASLNAGKWRILELATRGLSRAAEFTIVITGPVFCDTVEHIGANQVAVPCRLYKVVLTARGDRLAMYAAVLPNDHNPAEALSEFAAPVAEVERLTGLDFFPRLPAEEQARLESALARWN